MHGSSKPLQHTSDDLFPYRGTSQSDIEIPEGDHKPAAIEKKRKGGINILSKDMHFGIKAENEPLLEMNKLPTRLPN